MQADATAEPTTSTTPTAGTAGAADAAQSQSPAINRIGRADLIDALRRGRADFMAKPSHAVFLCIIYPLVALIASRLTFGYEVLPILFPLCAGFALVGPVAALGLYEMSRRREQGEVPKWAHAFEIRHSPAMRPIAHLALVLAAFFVLWLAVAQILYSLTLGISPSSVGGFLDQLFTTGAGWALIVLGNGVGLLFAVAVLSISVVSFPMILDRHVDAATAVRTSMRAVRQNPGAMAGWGLIVAGSLVLGTIPAFVGLALVVPILGHATWHLYRKTVA